MIPSVATSWPEAVYYRLQLFYGIVLLSLFIVSVAYNSVLVSRRATQLVRPAATGPGGRPLPATRRKSQDSNPGAFIDDSDISRTAKHLFAYTSTGVLLAFLANFTAVLYHIYVESHNTDDEYGWWCCEDTFVYYLSGIFMNLYVLLYLFECGCTPNISVVVYWVVSFALEVVLFVANFFRVSGRHHVLRNIVHDLWVTAFGPDEWDYVDIVIGASRISLLSFLLIASGSIALSRSNRNWVKIEVAADQVRHADEAAETSETTPLMNGHRTMNGSTYEAIGTEQSHGSPIGISTSDSAANGTTESSAAGSSSPEIATANNTNEGEETAFYRPRKLPHKTWWEYLTSYSLFFPYLWPRDSPRLKLVVVVCFWILVVQRVVNFLVPNQIGNITDAFEAKNGIPWLEISLFIFYKVLQGQSGVLGSVRALLWIPVSQYSYRALTTAAFEHVHSLSLDFHLGKRTGEVLSALNKGASINSFLEQVTFQVFPMLIDLLVAIIYFLIRFGPIYATIAGVITVFYLHMTVKMASARADLRRDMVNADREEEAVKNDSITSYETVKYFNAEAFEFNRYRQAICNFQVAEAKVTWGMNNMNICQALVFMCGILIMLIIAAVEVSQGLRSIGDFIILITYLGQLQGPLNFFGSFYRTVQQAMISGERLLELFKIQPTVVDREGVKALPGCRGHIRWSNVNFYYHKGRAALNNLSFDCFPGTTTAFVGESGGGKSTIFRLMFRYYNCPNGTIEIDDHDVKDVTIDSVRRHIGVVPQDTILFNETIMYNLKYANPSASDADVYDACRAASIHDRILSFPNGYNTKVGDRGTRLSGGEKQRVAIARTILKNPKIIMLDEATSALDSETEQQIQAKLIRGGSLGQDRTLLIIAHRLSTITHADQIIVLHAGAIVERGTHNELLAMKGRYASMWENQSQAEQAAVAARHATAHAKRLMREAHINNSPTQARGGDDGSDGCASLSSSTILTTDIATQQKDGMERDDSSYDDRNRRSNT